MCAATLTELTTWGIHLRNPKHGEITTCKAHRYHDFLMPFTHDNHSLLIKYNEIEHDNDEGRKEMNKGRFDELTSFKSGTKGHAHTPFHCIGYPFRAGSYNENEWTNQVISLY